MLLVNVSHDSVLYILEQSQWGLRTFAKIHTSKHTRYTRTFCYTYPAKHCARWNGFSRCFSSRISGWSCSESSSQYFLGTSASLLRGTSCVWAVVFVRTFVARIVFLENGIVFGLLSDRSSDAVETHVPSRTIILERVCDSSGFSWPSRSPMVDSRSLDRMNWISEWPGTIDRSTGPTSMSSTPTCPTCDINYLSNGLAAWK